MFIQNMTSAELAKEYRSDLSEIGANNERIDSSAYVSDLLKKNRKKDEVCFVRYFKTARDNTYINLFKYTRNAESTRKSAKWNWRVWSFGMMPTYKGTCAIGFFKEASLAIVFQTHFFNRYKERLMKVCDWQTRNQLSQAKTVEGIISIYIKRNPATTWINTKSKFGDKEHIFAPVNDGVALIQWDGENIQANTFITEDMLSYQQQKMSGQAKCAELLQREKDELFRQLTALINGEKSDKQ